MKSSILPHFIQNYFSKYFSIECGKCFAVNWKFKMWYKGGVLWIKFTIQCIDIGCLVGQIFYQTVF